ncbi:MAG: TrmH family RNA methyltransferase [Prolixibacteraceae bacterium]|jgi:tRNA G18 (ribose-2'-O)-methylase SpoU|nr:TrmH family RNA methyltransferase [Prolixibacteraceae bacterium]
METNSVEFFKQNNYQLPKGIAAPILVAWKLRTPGNYGYLLRLADTVGCEKVLFVVDEIHLAHRNIRKTAGESYKRMPFEFISADDIKSKIPESFQFVALETATNSKNIFKTKLPSNIALVVGNEKSGIETNFLAKCDQIVHIPLTGKCTSLNVSHATAIALYEWVRQKIM